MDIKTIFFIVSLVLNVIFFGFMMRGIWLGHIKPHMYTWLIWLITMAIVAMGVLEGGSMFTSIAVWSSVFFSLIIFILCFKYGTKDIHVIDGILLLMALAGIFIWVGLDNILWAVIIVTLVDALAYIPTYRKTFNDPWTEDVRLWYGGVIVTFFMFLSIQEYNLLSTLYIVVITCLNLVGAVGIGLRRRYLKAK